MKDKKKQRRVRRYCVAAVHADLMDLWAEVRAYPSERLAGLTPAEYMTGLMDEPGSYRRGDGTMGWEDGHATAVVPSLGMGFG